MIGFELEKKYEIQQGLILFFSSFLFLIVCVCKGTAREEIIRREK